jgi:hypothetical protein
MVRGKKGRVSRGKLDMVIRKVDEFWPGTKIDIH